MEVYRTIIFGSTQLELDDTPVVLKSKIEQQAKALKLRPYLTEREDGSELHYKLYDDKGVFANSNLAKEGYEIASIYITMEERKVLQIFSLFHPKLPFSFFVNGYPTDEKYLGEAKLFRTWSDRKTEIISEHNFSDEDYHISLRIAEYEYLHSNDKPKENMDTLLDDIDDILGEFK